MTAKSVQQGMQSAISVHSRVISTDIADQQKCRRFMKTDRSDDNTEIFIGVVDSQQESPVWTVNVIVNNCIALIQKKC